MYLTYDEIITFGLKCESPEKFNFIQRQNEKLIDKYTFSRIKNDTKESKATYEEDLKFLCVQLFQIVQKQEMVLYGTEKETKSMSNNGVSVTFQTQLTESQSGFEYLDKKIKNLIQTFLGGYVDSKKTNLLYRGVD